MRVAVAGANADALCRAAGVAAATFATPRLAAGRRWALLALTRDAASQPAPALRAQCLLLPGGSSPALARYAAQAVGYGFSPRDTLTLSSVRGTRLLCLQRSVVTLGGAILEPQELPLPDALAALPNEDAMLAALLQLLCDS